MAITHCATTDSPQTTTHEDKSTRSPASGHVRGEDIIGPSDWARVLGSGCFTMEVFMAAVGLNHVENLEGRMLLSANAVLEHGVIRVHGIEDSPNTIVVGNSADGLNVNVSVNTVKTNGVTK